MNGSPSLYSCVLVGLSGKIQKPETFVAAFGWVRVGESIGTGCFAYVTLAHRVSLALKNWLSMKYYRDNPSISGLAWVHRGGTISTFREEGLKTSPVQPAAESGVNTEPEAGC